MKANMGNIDRFTRAMLAIAMAMLFYLEIITGTIGTVLMIASIVFVLTSLFSFCPIYALFGASTCKTKRT